MTTTKKHWPSSSLIIVAHPNKQSFSHKIADQIISYYTSKWIPFHLLDLYDHPQWFLKLSETNRPLEDNAIDRMQTLIKDADELIFCFPLRRFDCPAILKNRMEVNLTSGFAYRYRHGKILPEKLLKGKTARVFITAWWPTRAYRFLSWFIRLLRYIGRINYVGMSLKSWTLFPDMNHYKTPHSRQWMLDTVRRVIR